jgi:hypothetical protein
MMERLTDAELEAIRKRAEAATEGPWYSEDNSVVYSEKVVDRKYGEPVEVADTSCGPDIGNAEFIAHAREDVPKLLAEVERLRDALEDIADTGESYHEHYCRDIAKEALRNA